MSISLQNNCLVLYKSRPAKVTEVTDKITIVLDDKKTKRVREKDIAVLHPGPIAELTSLNLEHTSSQNKLEEVWELLQGEEFSLSDLSELLFDCYTPDTAWAAWKAVSEGVHFEGKPERLATRSRESIEQDLESIRLKLQQEQERQQFYQHISNATLDENDRKKLSEVEMLALGKTDKSNILKTLDLKQTKESAHQLLIDCGYWDEEFNPFPGRAGIDMSQPELPVGELPEENRLDLTDIQAFAIDDEESNDPDDAISYDGDRFWVHVADVAALVRHDSAIDKLAASRASNLYLPEGLVNMLPETITEQLGLGLQQISPALSIGFKLDSEINPVETEIKASWIKAKRISYRQADQQLSTTFKDISVICDNFRQKRLRQNAAEIDLPEASVRIKDNDIVIKPFEKMGSRQMVTDAMLMAGQAVAQFCRENNIPIPFATQAEPERIEQPSTTSQMFAYRRQFKASRTSLEPEHHFGLGLSLYTRATSPLRRYLDLVVHQQLRLFLAGEPVLSEQELSDKILTVDQQSAVIRRTERFSNQHWKLVYLKRHPKWEGQAIIVEIAERKSTIIIPELAMETKIRTRDSFRLDDTIRLRINEVDLPEQAAFFQYLN